MRRTSSTFARRRRRIDRSAHERRICLAERRFDSMLPSSNVATEYRHNDTYAATNPTECWSVCAVCTPRALYECIANDTWCENESRYVATHLGRRGIRCLSSGSPNVVWVHRTAQVDEACRREWNRTRCAARRAKRSEWISLALMSPLRRRYHSEYDASDHDAHYDNDCAYNIDVYARLVGHCLDSTPGAHERVVEVYIVVVAMLVDFASAFEVYEVYIAVSARNTSIGSVHLPMLWKQIADLSINARIVRHIIHRREGAMHALDCGVAHTY